MNRGILKLNQRVTSEKIMLECIPGAISVKYAIDSINDIIKAGTTDLSNNFTLFHFTPIKCEPIWAVDLTCTSMSPYDFNYFIIEMRPLLSQLQVLILSTVKVSEYCLEHLMPLMESSCFKHLDLCRTIYSNRGIVHVLEFIARTNRSSDLSLKLIFSFKSYYKRLINGFQWVAQCKERGLLHRDWYLMHEQYYDTVEPDISQAKAIQLLTGDSEYDGKYDCDDEESRDSENFDSHLSSFEL